MRYRRRSCLHAGKRGQVQCRPFFTTFLLPRSIYLVPLAVLVLRLFAHFSYPLFISVLFSLCLADLLASSRVCCGSLSSCVHAGLEKSWFGEMIDISTVRPRPKVSTGHYSSEARSLLSVKIFT